METQIKIHINSVFLTGTIHITFFDFFYIFNISNSYKTASS